MTGYSKLADEHTAPDAYSSLARDLVGFLIVNDLDPRLVAGLDQASLGTVLEGIGFDRTLTSNELSDLSSLLTHMENESST